MSVKTHHRAGPLQESMVPDFSSVTIQSWSKFLKFNEDTVFSERDMELFVNASYDWQMERSVNLQDADQYGFVNIPDKWNWWLILYQNILYVLNQRRVINQKVIDSLRMNEVQKDPWFDKDSKVHQPIEKMEPSSYGHCLKFKIKIKPVSGLNMWMLCLDSRSKLDDWAFALKTAMESDFGMYDKADGASQSTTIRNPWGDGMNLGWDKNGGLGEGQGLDGDTDWKILSDWSQCSVACGGGTQTQQRKCPKPAPGAKPCHGSQILTRPCNTDPCPTSVEMEGQKKMKNAMIRTAQLSNKPWTYERCIINEVDMDMELSDLTKWQNKPRIPHRVVVNNQTLSIFQNFDYTTVQTTIKLNDLSIEKHAEENDCIILQNKQDSKKYTLCTIELYQGDHKAFIEEFKERTEFFRDSCKQEIPSVKGLRFQSESRREAGADKDLLNIRKEQEKNAVRGVEQEQAQNYVSQQDNLKESKDFEDFSKMAMENLAKEVEMGSKLVKEEDMKENYEDKINIVTLEQEKAKLEKIQMKEEAYNTNFLEDQKKKQSNEKIINMKKMINQVIEQIRAKNTQKMKQMQLLHEINNRQKKEEQEQIRIKTALKVMKSNNIGDSRQCKTGQSQKDMDAYCIKAFMEFEEIENCKNPENFCHACCDNEFGAARVAQRSNCYYSMCGGEKQYYGWKPVR